MATVTAADVAGRPSGRAGLTIGVAFPQTEIGNDPGVIRAFAQTAEELGYGYVTMADHVVGTSHADRDPALPAGRYDETHAFHEPLTTLAYLAGCTSRIELAVGVLVLPQRSTALVAKQATEVQLLSGGRLRLGVGVGWNWVEFEALGPSVRWAARGRYIEEQVHVLRLLSEHDLVDFQGEFHRIVRAGIKPRPEPRIPIWMGGSSVAYDRAARLADGFMFNASGPEMRTGLAALRERLRAHGRPVDRFPTEIRVDFARGPEALAAELEAWAKAGGTHVTLRTTDAAGVRYGAPSNAFARPEDHIDAIARFKEWFR
jgi:probable F420-dependent oxidoreductase